MCLRNISTFDTAVTWCVFVSFFERYSWTNVTADVTRKRSDSDTKWVHVVVFAFRPFKLSKFLNRRRRSIVFVIRCRRRMRAVGVSGVAGGTCVVHDACGRFTENKYYLFNHELSFASLASPTGFRSKIRKTHTRFIIKYTTF